MTVPSIDPTRIAVGTDPRTKRMTGMTAHGFIPFDVPFISEIAPGLWQGGCEKGLVLPGHIKHLVSLYPWEQYRVKHELGSTTAVRMLDSTGQETGQIPALAAWVNTCRRSGPVLVRCQAGLNRSSLVTATALMLGGMTAAKAIALIRAKRSPACLCNPAFEGWLREWRPGKESAGNWMTTGEVAAAFRVSARSVIRRVDSGRLSCTCTAGGHRRFDSAEVEALLGGRGDLGVPSA